MIFQSIPVDTVPRNYFEFQFWNRSQELYEQERGIALYECKKGSTV